MSDTTTNRRDSGKVYWRSLDQLAETPEFQEILHREFPDGVAQAPDDVSRRGFLGVVAASVALAGLTSCRKPKTKILPFAQRPEDFAPGMPSFYATAHVRSGYGVGTLVRSNDGRPTKIEGNPLHPSSLGSTDGFAQGELLNLYDPGRSQHARHGAPTEHDDHADDGHGGAHGAGPTAWDEFANWWLGATGHAGELVTTRGRGLRVLMAPTSSPTMLHMVDQLREVYPDAAVHVWDPLHRDSVVAGSSLAFGRALDTQWSLDKAQCILALDCDFLAVDAIDPAAARRWAQNRKITGPGQEISRLYAVESSYTTTGTMADHRYRVRQQDIPAVVFALAAELGIGQGTELGNALATYREHGFRHGGKDWIATLAADLQGQRGRCAVLAGPRLPAAAQAVVHAINAALDAVGNTSAITATPASMALGCVESIRELARDMGAGNVDTLVILGANPAYDAPADLEFARLLREKKVAHTIHLGRYDDETGRLCDWHFNEAHDLESWGDIRATDGTLTVMQQMVAPLFGGASAIEFLAWLIDHPVLQAHPLTGAEGHRDGSTGHELVRSYWRDNGGATDFENWWRHALHDGLVAGTAWPTESPPALQTSAIADVIGGLARGEAASITNLELVFRADAKVLDGRYGNNSWMQELPDPLTKLTWDNAALMGSATAGELGVENGDDVALAVEGRPPLEVPVWILPGHAEHSITLTLGYGRELGDDCRVARGAGFNAYGLRTSARQHLATRVRVSPTGRRYKLVSTQDHGTMVGRPIVREENLGDFTEQNKDWATMMSPLAQNAALHGQTEADLNKSLWPERGYEDPERSEDPHVKASPYQWGMVIDLNSCTGCSACVVACVAENNIPAVGKTQVASGREMQWLRLDRYFSTPADDEMTAAEDPQVSNMPVPCMQCENAPCESVCPVNATQHSPDGLNDMAYNRCIGTRYCSNNCPYKVRRFNWFDFHGRVPETKKMVFNPDVTVRSRGVMEKCTYCVQRITSSRVQAKLEDRLVRDGEIKPACAQTCPTQAITFGNILDTDSAVVKLRNSPLNYGVLSEMNLKPRTTYLGRLRNPNPDLS